MFIQVIGAVALAGAEPPEDYAGVAAMARACEDPAEAVEAWRRAEALAGGNYEAAAEQVAPLLELGRIAEAQDAADRACLAAPGASLHDCGGSVDALLLRVEALRQALPHQAPERAVARAHRVVRDAVALDADSAGCALAWDRVRRGVPTGGADCEPALPVASTQLSGGLYLARVDYGAYASTVVALGAGARGSGWSLDSVGRSIRTPAEQGGTIATREVWGRGGVDRGVWGGWGMVGLRRTTGQDDTLTFAGRTWAPLGALTPRIEGAWSPDGAQLGLAVRVPLSRSWVLDTGGQLTGGDALSGHASLTLRGDAGTLSLGGRLGREVSPLRLDPAYAWSLPDELGDSASLDGALVLTPGLRLHAGLETLSLPDAPATMVTVGISGVTP